MQVRQDPDADVGVIIGRFQVPSLHDGHLDVISHVRQVHDKVLLFLGLSPLLGTRENPLDLEARKQMIQDVFPDVNVLYIKDMPSDDAWSRKLDSMIEDNTTPAQTVALYGGRDSFQNRYSGRFSTYELEADTIISGSQVRKEVSRKSVRGSADFRAGVVWAAFNRFPTAYQTVDVAIFNDDYTRLLLGKKEAEDKYRLIGGFSHPHSESLEEDCRREVQEEAGIAITDPVYVTSQKVDDWRYRTEVDCVKTALFHVKVLHGAPRPGDDIAEVKWFDTDTLDPERDVVPEHRELVQKALTAITDRK